jgi:hypothetical protein
MGIASDLYERFLNEGGKGTGVESRCQSVVARDKMRWCRIRTGRADGGKGRNVSRKAEPFSFPFFSRLEKWIAAL